MRYRVRLTAADGTIVFWRKAERIHTLDERLGPVWLQNFKPAIFQLLPNGDLVPRGTPGAHDVIAWELVADEGTAASI